MECQGKIETIYQYLDKELGPQNLKTFENHLRQCPACQKILAEEKQFDGAMRGGLKKRQAPDGLFEGIVERLDQQEPDAGPAQQPFSVKEFFRMLTGNPLVLRLGTAGLVAIIAVSLIFVPRQSAFPVFTASINAFVQSRKSSVPLEVASGDVKEIIDRLNGRVAFQLDAPHIINTDAKLTGAKLSKVGGKDAVEFHYQYGRKDVTAYYMDLNGEKLPDIPQEQIMDKGEAVWYIQEHDGYTSLVCFHKWDKTACIIVSDLPSTEVLALMMEKGGAQNI